ncbi:MAG: DUF2079 domain-containing protein [Microcoleus anatoxicus]|uniref:DUF2079 domain-containing protein n=1 Tax=Microcoleus anatoxicus TaxID=2705319 RepID=UPI00366CBC07
MRNESNFDDSSEDSGVSITENIEESRSQPPSSLLIAIATTATILFLSSSLRHALFQSTAFDLGIFDQAIYLISQNQTPFSSLMQMHILGDHAAVIYYPLAWLYKIYPDVHWLFLVQAVALSLGAWPSWSLARLASLNPEQSRAIAFIYLLYPVVFNINLFDFHPEVIALPALLAAIFAASLNKILWFSAAILLILSCKAVLSLTVAAMGLWLLLCEKKQRCGAIALVFGVAWFVIASQKIIPFFSGSEVAGVGRYSYLGKSVLEIIINIILKPQLILGKFFSIDTFKYIFLLSLPLFWGLLPFSSKIGMRYLLPLLPALPTLAINILSDLPFQRSLAYQYSVPIIPFLLLAVISKSTPVNSAQSNPINPAQSTPPYSAQSTPPYPPQGGKLGDENVEFSPPINSESTPPYPPQGGKLGDENVEFSPPINSESTPVNPAQGGKLGDENVEFSQPINSESTPPYPPQGGKLGDENVEFSPPINSESTPPYPPQGGKLGDENVEFSPPINSESTPPYPPQGGKLGDENVELSPPINSESTPPYPPQGGKLGDENVEFSPPINSESTPPYPPQGGKLGDENVEFSPPINSESTPPYPPQGGKLGDENVELSPPINSVSTPPYPPQGGKLGDENVELWQKINSVFPLKIYPIPELWRGMQLPKAMIIWSLIIFLFLGEYKDFFLYLNRLDTWQATREAIAQIQPQSSILTDNRLAPHFAHRPIVKLLSQISPQTDLAEFKYILLNQRHPWPDTEKIGNNLATQLQNTPQFQLTYQKNQVLLFKRIAD